MNRTPEQEISSESKNATTGDCDIPICKKKQEETNGCLLFTSSESPRVARPKLPLLTFHPPPVSEEPYQHQSDESLFVSSEVIHELDEEHGSSTLSSNRDGRLTPSFLDPPFSPWSSIGNRSSFSYFSYLGNNFTRSSTGSPVIIVGNGIILSGSSSSFKSRLPSNSVNYPEVFESDETARLNKVIDYCSCLCCVKALFYHCSKDCDEEEIFNEDNLCACDKPGSACMKRWGILSLLACCMPLLIFYPPLKAIQNATRKLRKRFQRKGLGS